MLARLEQRILAIHLTHLAFVVFPQVLEGSHRRGRRRGGAGGERRGRRRGGAGGERRGRRRGGAGGGEGQEEGKERGVAIVRAVTYYWACQVHVVGWSLLLAPGLLIIVLVHVFTMHSSSNSFRC